MCLVFEPLGKSLYDFIKDNKFKGFEIGDLREIVNQSLKAIEFLHSINLTHTDLKPENILLKSDKHEVITDEARIPIVSIHFFHGDASKCNERERYSGARNAVAAKMPAIFQATRKLFNHPLKPIVNNYNARNL